MRMIPRTSAFFLGWCVALGGTTALGSQAYTGGSQKSIHFQRALFILWIILIPVCVLWCFIIGFIVAWPTARDSQTILRILCVGAPSYIGYQSLKKYLQGQGEEKNLAMRILP